MLKGIVPGNNIQTDDCYHALFPVLAQFVWESSEVSFSFFKLLISYSKAVHNVWGS